MNDPDPKCRHFGILWHFGTFAKKSNKKSNPIFPILSDFFPIFRLFLTFRLSDSTALVRIQPSSVYNKAERLLDVLTPRWRPA